MAQEHTYIAIDLKSFYASAECAAHGLDPLNANLVVADASRTDKTICLAVSPAGHAYLKLTSKSTGSTASGPLSLPTGA